MTNETFYFGNDLIDPGCVRFTCQQSSKGVKAVASLIKEGPYDRLYLSYRERNNNPDFLLQVTMSDVEGNEPLTWRDPRLLWQSTKGVAQQEASHAEWIGWFPLVSFNSTANTYIRMNLFSESKDLIIVDCIGKTS